MQTFLPYPDYEKTAKCLDYRRLGKQRIETLQILDNLMGRSKGWINHPAVKMWQGYEAELVRYGLVMCREWINRGYKDTRTPIFENLLSQVSDCNKPNWMNSEFHLSHQSNLLRKDFNLFSIN